MARMAARISGKSVPSGTSMPSSARGGVLSASETDMSAPQELGLALFVERAYAFQPIIGGDDAVIGLDLEGEAGGEVDLHAVANGLLGLAHRDRGIVADRARRRERARHEVRRLAQRVDHPPMVRVFCAERLAGKNDFLGAALAHGARQVLRAAGARPDA